MSWFLFVLAILNLLTCVYFLGVQWSAARSLRRLAELDDLPSPEPQSVSIIVPARNEERHIAAGVRSLLRQAYQPLEIVVVNDRSTDSTGEVLGQLQEEHPELTVVTIEELPPGWLGKNHALHVAWRQARGEILLFTDADVVMRPDTVTRAVAYMQREGLDHLALTPDPKMPTWLLESFVVTFAIFFMAYFRPWRARDPDSPYYIGIGAFNMIRREALERAGGLEPIAMRPDDDVKLGKILKDSGSRQELVEGLGQIEVPWYGSLSEVIVGLEKNAFSGVDYQVWVVVGSSAVALAFNVWPFVAMFVTSGVVQWLNIVISIVLLLVAVRASLVTGKSPWCALLFPLTVVLFVYIQWRAMLLTLWQGGIRWRDTFYPLKELKANRV